VTAISVSYCSCIYDGDAAISGPVPLYISPRIKKKLAEKHQVSEDEIKQCFQNFEGDFIRDTREEHQTEPPTWWFISETNRMRKLKIAFVARKVEDTDGQQTRVDIKSAFPPDLEDIECWERHGKC
jgi:hypothetical protein